VERIAVLQLRDNLAEILNRVAYTKGRFIVYRYGKELAAIVPVEEVEKPEGRRTSTKAKQGSARRRLGTARSGDGGEGPSRARRTRR